MFMFTRPTFDGIIGQLAEDFLSERPVERWLKPHDWLSYGDADTSKAAKMYARNETVELLTTWNGDSPELAREKFKGYLKELRTRKEVREAALLEMVLSLVSNE